MSEIRSSEESLHMRRLALPLCLVLAGSLVLSAGAVPPRLSSADVAAVRGLSGAATKMTQQLKPAIRASATRTLVRFRDGCAARYATETAAHNDAIVTMLGMIFYLQAGKDSLSLYDAFAAKVGRTTVTNALLRAAKTGAAVERSQTGLMRKIKLDVCAEIAKLAASGYRSTYPEEWYGALMKQVGVDNAAATRADKMIHASRPALLSAGLTAAQAKVLMDAETADVFGVVMGLK